MRSSGNRITPGVLGDVKKMSKPGHLPAESPPMLLPELICGVLPVNAAGKGLRAYSLAHKRRSVGAYNLNLFFCIFLQCSFNPAVSLRVPSQNARLSCQA